MQTIGDRMKLARERTGMTQWELALQTQIQTTALSRLEGNQRELRAAEAPAVARALGVTLRWLLEGE